MFLELIVEFTGFIGEIMIEGLLEFVIDFIYDLPSKRKR